MNKVILIGHVATDPEYAETQSGIARCTFRVGVQRKFADANGNRQSDFFNVICWRSTADFVYKFMNKGRKVAIEGSLQTRSYDAQDGSKRYVTEVIADSVEFCDKNPDQQARQNQNYAPAPEPPRGQQMNMRDMLPNDGFTEVDDDELPF